MRGKASPLTLAAPGNGPHRLARTGGGTRARSRSGSGRWCLLLLAWPGWALAQGTWLHTACLAAAGATGLPPAPVLPATSATDTPTPTGTRCKATPAWGQTGLDFVQSLAAAAGPGNLGISLAKPQTLPAANAARTQLSTVMLAYLDGELPLTSYRWYGPVAANPLTATKLASAAPAASGAAATTAAVTTSTSPGALPATAAAIALNPVQANWRLGALGDEPSARSASWWLAAPYLGSPGPVAPPALAATGAATGAATAAAQRYTVLNFLATQCPQLDGKVAPNAWTRCTTREIPEPASWALAALALAAAAAFSARQRAPARQQAHRPR